MRHSRRWMLGLVAGFAIQMLMAPVARAQEGAICPVCHRSTSQQDDAAYASKAGHTLVRGAANVLFGWTDLIRQPAVDVKQGGNVFSGLAHGLGQGLKRTAGGVAEVLTFWTPKVNGNYLKFSQDCPVCRGKAHPSP